MAHLVNEGGNLTSVPDSGMGVADMAMTLAVFYNADSMLDGKSSSVAGDFVVEGDYGLDGYGYGVEGVVEGSSATSDLWNSLVFMVIAMAGLYLVYAAVDW